MRRQDRSKLVVAVAVAFVVYYKVPYAIDEAGEVGVNDLHT